MAESSSTQSPTQVELALLQVLWQRGPSTLRQSLVRRWMTRLVACVAVTALLAPIARAEDASTPKKAAIAFAKAVQANNQAAVKQLSTGTDAEYALIKQFSNLVGATKNLESAAVKKFGNEGKLPKDMEIDLTTELENADEKIDGDTATLISKNRPDDKFPPTLKKVGDGWKMDLTNLSKDPQNATIAQMVPPQIKAIDTVTKNIAADKYKTAAEAYTDLRVRMAAATEPPK